MIQKIKSLVVGYLMKPSRSLVAYNIEDLFEMDLHQLCYIIGKADQKQSEFVASVIRSKVKRVLNDKNKIGRIYSPYVYHLLEKIRIIDRNNNDPSTNILANVIKISVYKQTWRKPKIPQSFWGSEFVFAENKIEEGASIERCIKLIERFAFNKSDEELVKEIECTMIELLIKIR